MRYIRRLGRVRVSSLFFVDIIFTETIYECTACTVSVRPLCFSVCFVDVIVKSVCGVQWDISVFIY